MFNDVPIGFVSSTNEAVLRSVEGSKTIGPVPFEDQFNLNKGHNLGLRAQHSHFQWFIAQK